MKSKIKETLRCLLFWKYEVCFYHEIDKRKTNFVVSYYLRRHKSRFNYDMKVLNELSNASRNGASEHEIYRIATQPFIKNA